MKRATEFREIHFSADLLRRASEKLFGPAFSEKGTSWLMTVTMEESEWTHDTEEEFFADYQTTSGNACFIKMYKDKSIVLHRFRRETTVRVEAADRQTIQAVFNVFESSVEQSRLPKEAEPEIPKPTVFIGHGNSPLWRELMDHLHHQHGYPVEAFETGARAGHTVRDVLEHMLRDSSFAVLVMTGEDETVAGTTRARQNVIHEAGLFQGRLGFSRSVVLLEMGTEEFSNIHGVQQIRFSKGNIRETFGDILATLRREFLEGSS